MIICYFSVLTPFFDDLTKNMGSMYIFGDLTVVVQNDLYTWLYIVLITMYNCTGKNLGSLLRFVEVKSQEHDFLSGSSQASVGHIDSSNLPFSIIILPNIVYNINFDTVV